MTRKMRYSLLITGFIFFCALAPALILFVQGKLPDFNTKKTTQTGIISVTTEPRGAVASLNDKTQEPQTTPAAFRFLSPGNYKLSLEKPGYRTWQKSLTVLPSKVTLVNPEPEKLILLKDEPALEIAKDIQDYLINDREFITLTQDGQDVLQVDERGAVLAKYKLPARAEKLFGDFKEGFVLLKTSNDMLASQLDFSQNMQFASLKLESASEINLIGGKIFYLQNNNLYSLDLEKLPNPKPLLLLENVVGYSIFDEDIYYYMLNSNKKRLYHAKFLQGKPTAQQILLEEAAELTMPRMLMDTSKALFILDTKKLYRVGGTLELIAENISFANAYGGVLVFGKPGELWWYESSANKPHLVLRTEENFQEAYFQKDLQYIFFITKSELKAAEIRSEGGQNLYTLDSGTSLSHLSRSGKNLVYLKDNRLLSLPILP